MKAAGIIETRGMLALVAAADAMQKAADVRLCGRHQIGAGWITAVVEGEVAAVQTALQVGERAAAVHGELITSQVIARPAAAPLAAMPHNAAMPASNDERAIGMLETQGLAPLVAAADALAKAAPVQLAGWAFIGGGLAHVAVVGDVAAVRESVAAGAVAAAAAGPVIADLVLPQPSPDTFALMPARDAAVADATGALGVLESTGYVGAVAAADAMSKAGSVAIRRFAVASGGRIATFTTGPLDDVKVALEAGTVATERVGELSGTHLVSRPDVDAVACFCGVQAPAVGGSGEAMGLIETRSTVGVVKAVDEMLKAAPVRFEGNFKVGYFLTASVVRGSIGAVQSALDVGATVAARYGDLVSVDVIPFPFADVAVSLPHQ